MSRKVLDSTTRCRASAHRHGRLSRGGCDQARAGLGLTSECLRRTATPQPGGDQREPAAGGAGTGLTCGCEGHVQAAVTSQPDQPDRITISIT